MRTVISACAGCHQLIIKGSDGTPWRVMPDRGEVLYPHAAELCLASRDGRHHSPAEVS